MKNCRILIKREMSTRQHDPDLTMHYFIMIPMEQFDVFVGIPIIDRKHNYVNKNVFGKCIVQMHNVTP